MRAPPALLSIIGFAYDQIMSDISAEMIDQNKKFKIMIFVLKKSTLKITFKSDISNDSNFQILHITDIDIDDCMIINIYNEKNFNGPNQMRIPSAPFSTIGSYRPNFDLFSWNNPPKTTLYEDFWWFSYRRIFSPIFSFMS